MMKYNEKILALRKANGFTQEGFAKAVGVTRQAVYKWEVGDSYPEAEKLIAIKMLFGISIDDLLDDNYEVVVERVKKPRKRRPPPPAPPSRKRLPNFRSLKRPRRLLPLRRSRPSKKPPSLRQMSSTSPSPRSETPKEAEIFLTSSAKGKTETPFYGGRSIPPIRV